MAKKDSTTKLLMAIAIIAIFALIAVVLLDVKLPTDFKFKQAPLNDTELVATCADFHIANEYRDEFGDFLINDARDNCTALGGTWTEGSNELSCWWNASVASVNCDGVGARLQEQFCEEDLLADWECDNTVAYAGCSCDKSLPGNWENANDQGAGEEEQGGPPLSDRTIFVTSIKWNGAMGGLNGMDQKCQVTGEFAGIGSNWAALASDSGEDARSRLGVFGDARYVRLDGVQIADNTADLWDGTIDNPINVDEKGETTEGAVWTGTGITGVRTDNNCNNWGWVDAIGSQGLSSSVSAWWISTGSTQCVSAAHLYCYQTSMVA